MQTKSGKSEMLQLAKSCEFNREYHPKMLLYLIFPLAAVVLAIVLWLIQPYKNWKKNFDSRQYEPITITDLKEKVHSLAEYREKCKKEVDLSLVVPSYNEEERLPVMLQETFDHLKKQNSFKYEIIIANDGSKDNTTKIAIAKAIELKIDLVVVEYPKNRGKGGAVRAGVQVAQGEQILMVDADGATTFSDFDKVSAKLQEIMREKDHPLVMVVGSRRHLEEEGKVERKFHRKFLSAVFKFVITLILGIKTKDTQCGFKLFSKKSAEILFSTLHIERFAFDVELFFLCNKFGVETAEVPVEWRDVDGSKLNVVDATVNMFRDVLMIRFYYLIGLWKYTDKVSVK